MKAFILAAGNGTRLHPLTARVPKCLVPIRGVPMLQLWLELCARYGIHEATVNVHAHPAPVREFVKFQRTPVAVRLFEEPTLLGSAGTLRANADWVGREREFFVFYGDVLTNLNIGGMLRFHRSKGMPATIAVHEVAKPTDCGIAELDRDGIVQTFIEKPSQPRGNLGFSGLMIASPQILKEVPPTGAADIGYDLLPRMVGRMSAYRTSEYLLDIGTLDAYEEAQRTWPGLDGNGPECECRQCRMEGIGDEECPAS